LLRENRALWLTLIWELLAPTPLPQTNPSVWPRGVDGPSPQQRGRLRALKNLRIGRNRKAWDERGMSETQFFVILIAASVAVAFLAAALTGMFEIERVFEMLPLFEDVIGD
jgi:hypothetical protein